MMWPYKCFICYEKGDNKENETAVFPSILRSLLALSLYLISQQGLTVPSTKLQCTISGNQRAFLFKIAVVIRGLFERGFTPCR